MKPERTQEILGIIIHTPGVSGAGIYRILLARSWAGRRFGVDSGLAILFGPSIAGIYPHLARLEAERLIEGRWVEGPYPRRRVYFPVFKTAAALAAQPGERRWTTRLFGWSASERLAATSRRRERSTPS